MNKKKKSRFVRHSAGFLISFLINLVLHFEGILPALVLLIAHFIWDWPIWPVWVALAIWLLGILIYMKLFTFAVDSASEPEPVKENKNPYSVGQKK